MGRWREGERKRGRERAEARGCRVRPRKEEARGIASFPTKTHKIHPMKTREDGGEDSKGRQITV
jgi:hypothetical protein